MDIGDYIKEDPELLGRMYDTYKNYFINKGCAPEDLMDFERWKTHLNLH